LKRISLLEICANGASCEGFRLSVSLLVGHYSLWFHFFRTSILFIIWY
jgi:hypothetical protein